MSSIGSTPYFNPLTQSLPGSPDDPTSLQSQIPPGLLEQIFGATAAQARTPVSSAGAASMRSTSGSPVISGPPPAPTPKASPRCVAAYDSLRSEMETTFVSAGRHAATLPQGGSMPTGQEILEASPEEGAAKAASWLNSLRDNLEGASNSMFRSFCILRLQASQAGLSDLQAMAQLASDLQNSSTVEQVAKAKEAEAAQAKAQKKAAKLGILSKFVSAIMLVLAVALTVLTMGAAAPLGAYLALAAAMVAGFIVGATKNGGFDVWKGIDFASYAAGGVAIAVAIGQLARSALVACSKAATQAAEAGAKTGLQTGTRAGAVAGTTATENAVSGAAQTASQQAMRASIKGAQEGLTTLAKNTKQLWDDMIAMFQQGMGNALNKLPQGLKAGLLKGAQATDDVAAKQLGDTTRLLGIAFGLATGATLATQGVAEFATAQVQLHADEVVAAVKQLQVMSDLYGAMYKTINGTLQNFQEAHTKAVDSVQSILKSNQQANMAVLNAWSQL